MEKTHIGILSYYPFPEGMAPTTRIIAYSKGLCANGAVVDIYSFAFLEKTQKPIINGNIGDVKYHMSPIHHTANHFTNAFKRYIGIRVRTIIDIYKAHSANPFQCLLISFDNLGYMLSFVPILRMFGIRLVFIGDEFPPPIRALKTEVPKWQLLLYKLIYKFIDRRVLMTKQLEEFYNNKVSMKPTFLLNSIIDLDRFKGVSSQEVDREYFCYMGNMMLAKDDVCTIVRAFSLITEDFPGIDLYLYGTPGKEDYHIVKNLIDKLRMGDRVVFKGRASYEQVPQILSNATALLTAQPQTVRAQGGFPTKLGEYMMSKRPVVLTDVGEIHCYVQDGVNVFMVTPENPEEYAQAIKKVLTDKEKTAQIVENAYQLACNQYGNVYVTKPLLSFLEKK